MLPIERMVHWRLARSTPTTKSDEATPPHARPRASTTADARTVVSDDVDAGTDAVKTSGGAWASRLTAALEQSVRAHTADRKNRTIKRLPLGSGLDDQDREPLPEDDR